MNIIDLLANGEFFFSNEYDLQKRLQDQIDSTDDEPDPITSGTISAWPVPMTKHDVATISLPNAYEVSSVTPN